MLVLVLLLLLVANKLIKLKNPSNFEGSDSSIVTIGDGKYIEKTLTTILIIGQDSYGPIIPNHSYNNQEQADFLALLSIDKSTNSYSLLHINRDTMTGVMEYGVTGDPIGTRTCQIALAHTYGDGAKASCVNTCTAVSKLLYGVTVDYYISMSTDAIKIANDYIGGVSVKFPKDYTDIDESFKKDETVTLDGEQALSFVQSRLNVEDETNIARMERQRIYINAFISQLMEMDINDGFISSLYNKEKDYICTNCYDLGSMRSILNSVKNYTFDGISSIEGEARPGTKFMEFYPDEDKLRELVTSMYFKRYLG